MTREESHSKSHELTDSFVQIESDSQNISPMQIPSEGNILKIYNTRLQPVSSMDEKSSQPLQVLLESNHTKEGEIKEQDTASSVERRWMMNFLQHVLGWVLPVSKGVEPTSMRNTESIIEDWEWVLSNAEEYAMKKVAEDNTRIQNELASLKRVGTSFKLRGYFQKCIKETFSFLDIESANLLVLPLDASKRSKIISNVVDNYAESWLEFLKFNFAYGKNPESWVIFEENYYEKKPYEKGVVGSIKELAFSASHGLKHIGLNDKVLSDILWSIWKTLTEAIRIAGFELDDVETELIANEIVECNSYFIDLWINTVKTSKNGSKREGMVVQKWKKQEEEEKKKFKQRIALKGVDAKYQVQKYQFQSCKSKKEMENLKKVLEERLTFSVV